MTNDPGLRDAQDREQEQTARIRELNDALRTASDPLGVLLARGQPFITRGVAGHGSDFVARAIQTVRALKLRSCHLDLCSMSARKRSIAS
jgi:hypothetical protein